MYQLQLLTNVICHLVLIKCETVVPRGRGENGGCCSGCVHDYRTALCGQSVRGASDVLHQRYKASVDELESILIIILLILHNTPTHGDKLEKLSSIPLIASNGAKW